MASLLPYVSPVVITSMDVQLMSLAVACAVLMLLLMVTPGVFTLYRTDLVLLAAGIFTLLYLDPHMPSADIETSLRACAPIILGLPVYYSVRTLYRYMLPQVFVGVVALYLVVLVVQLVFPSLYNAAAGHLLSEARFAAEEGRGPNGLTNEPSMMGNMCVLFAVSLYFFHRSFWQRHRRARLFVLLASGLMLLITKSATGVFLALVVFIAALLAAKTSKKMKSIFLATMAGAVLLSGSLLSVSDSRGAIVLTSLASNPLLIFQDQSFATRLTGTFVGTYALPEQPFGNGSARQDIGLTNAALNSDLAISLWPSSTMRDLLVAVIASRSNISGIGGMIQRMGIFAILATLLIVFLTRGFREKWVVRLFVLGLLLNASMFIPTLWFIVGSCVELQATKEI
ncbi:MAG: hypothetical protein JST28_03435 [Acidobacteria bacterium]|nr:hypothetical protein [Acidobacteriota bacterium]